MTDTEIKETITFDEFQAWLTGLIRGMNGQLPGVDEWKQIKQMMNKVVPQKEYIQNPPMPIPRSPSDTPQWQWPQDRWPYYEIWCSDQSSNVTNSNNTQDLGNSSSGKSTTTQINLALDDMIESNDNKG